MNDIRYQFLQVESAYPNGVFHDDYRVPGYIVFDKTRGTITVVKEKTTAPSPSGYTEYGGGIKSVTAGHNGQVFTFTDSFGNTIDLDMSRFADDTQIETLQGLINQLGDDYTTLSGRISGAEGSIANLSGRLDNVYTKVETNQAITDAISALGSVFEFKGSVQFYSDLPKSNVEAGDVWQVTTSGETTGGDPFPANTEFFYATYRLMGYTISENLVFSQGTVYTKNVAFTTETINRIIPVYNYDGAPLKVGSVRAYVKPTAVAGNIQAEIVDKDGIGLYDKLVTLTYDSSRTGNWSSWEILGTDTTSGMATVEEVDTKIKEHVEDTINYAGGGQEDYIPVFMNIPNGDGTSRSGFITSGKKFTDSIDANSKVDDIPNAKIIYQALCWHTLN